MIIYFSTICIGSTITLTFHGPDVNVYMYYMYMTTWLKKLCHHSGTQSECGP